EFAWDFIDGVPEGPVVGPSSGRRSGVRASGNDAGRYVSAVIDRTGSGDVLHAVYQHVVSKEGITSLRYLRGVRGSAGWSWTTIDVDSLDIAGMFPTIALLPGESQEPGLSQNIEGNLQEAGGIGIVYMSSDIAVDP